MLEVFESQFSEEIINILQANLSITLKQYQYILFFYATVETEFFVFFIF